MSAVKLVRSKKTAVSWIAGICVMAVVPALTGCSADSTKTNSSKSDSSKTTDAKGSASTADATPSQKGQSGAGDQSSARGAVATWVTAVVQDRAKEACLAMANPGMDGAPPTPNTAEMCSGDGQEAKEMKEQVHRVHTAFTPDQPKNPPTVKVAEVPVTDKKATVDGEQITVDGQTLKAIVLSNSTGVEEDEVEVRIEVGVREGRWYVTDLRLSLL